MPPWYAGYLTANGLKLHYYRTGGDKPPVVLNHGIMDDGLCWTRLAKALEADYDVIMPDARGHGRSASGRGVYSGPARAADLAGLIEALGLAQPVVGGHSMGADTAMHLAAHHPGLVRAIFLEDPPLLMPGEPVFGGQQGSGEKKDVGTAMALEMLPYKLLPQAIGLRLAHKNLPAYSEDDLVPWVRSKQRMSPDLAHAPKGLNFDPDYMFGVLQQINTPVLLITGDKELGAIVSRAGAARAAQVHPRLRLAHIPGTGHDIRRVRFTEYYQALQDFLGSTESLR